MGIKGLLIGIAGVVGLLVIVGITNNGGPGTASVGASHGSGVTRDGVPQQAPGFELETLEGDRISLAEYKGVKPVILDFWASWCPNCRRDMPKLQKLYEKYGDQVEVIAINLQESESKARGFVEAQGFTYPIAMDPSSKAARAYQIQYTNSHYLIDKEGNLVQPVIGDINESHFKLLLES